MTMAGAKMRVRVIRLRSNIRELCGKSISENSVYHVEKLKYRIPRHSLTWAGIARRVETANYGRLIGPAETALPTCRSIAGVAAWPSRMNGCEFSWRRTLNKAEEMRELAFSGFLQHLVS
jgi:hypothetical protein